MELTLKLPFLRSDKDPARPVMGSDKQLLADGLHGRHFETTRTGRMFIATSATGGIALIVAATTGGHPTLWNPLGSQRIISIKRLLLGYVAGANAPGSLAWNITKNAGGVAATGGPIPTATQVAVDTCFAGSVADSKAIWSPTTNTFTAAPAFYRPCSISLFTGVAATAVAPFQLIEEYDGDFLVDESTAVSLVSQQATTTATFRIAVIFEEVDKNK